MYAIICRLRDIMFWLGLKSDERSNQQQRGNQQTSCKTSARWRGRWTLLLLAGSRSTVDQGESHSLALWTADNHVAHLLYPTTRFVGGVVECTISKAGRIGGKASVIKIFLIVARFCAIYLTCHNRLGKAEKEDCEFVKIILSTSATRTKTKFTCVLLVRPPPPETHQQAAEN